MKWILILFLIVVAACAGTPKQKIQEPVATASAQAKAVTKNAVTPAPIVPVAAKSGRLSCANGPDARWLEVVKKGAGCSLKYSKDGKVSEIASSLHGTKHCKESQSKVESKLEKAGFHCDKSSWSV